MKRLTDGLVRLNPAADDNPKLADFHQSLIYVVNHDENGAIGVNLNKFFQSTPPPALSPHHYARHKH